MVAGPFTQNGSSEECNGMWLPRTTAATSSSSNSSSTVPCARVVPAPEMRTSLHTARHNGNSGIISGQNSVQNSVNANTSSARVQVHGVPLPCATRGWADQHVDPNTAAPVTPCSSTSAIAARSSTMVLGRRQEKPTAKTTQRAAAMAPAPMQMSTFDKTAATRREALQRERVASWDVAITGPTTDASATRTHEPYNGEVQSVLQSSVAKALKVEEAQTSESDADSRASSPALSTSSESKRSSNSPNSPPLEVVRNANTSATAADVLFQTLPSPAIATTATTAIMSAPLTSLPAARPKDKKMSPPAQTQVPTVSSYIAPCVPFTESVSDSSTASLSTTSSPVPSFNMSDIAEALRRTPEDQHPFLDMAYQRRVRDHEKAQEHLNFHMMKPFQNQLSASQQAAAFKCLLNAAHRHQHQQCVAKPLGERAMLVDNLATAAPLSGAQAPSQAGRWGPRQRRLIHRQWRMTAEQMECDLFCEGLGAVQRKLSCMCLFNPGTDVRVYEENSNMREQRCYRQHKLLVRLQRQRMKGGNACFLDTSY